MARNADALARLGITIPFELVPLADQPAWYAELAAAGYTDLWSAEADGTDAFVPLALAATAAHEARLGTAVVPVYTRGPALLAQQIDTVCELAPGRVVIGLGASSDVIVERWNGIPYAEPYKRVRDTLRYLRMALTGEKTTVDSGTITSQGFRLGRRRADRVVPPIVLAALRPGMLHLAGREADGAILNFLSAEDVAAAVAEVRTGAKAAVEHAAAIASPTRAEPEIIARIFICPSEDADAVRAIGRMLLAAYLNVHAYAEFHRWLGRAEVLEPMWEAWGAGDRQKALSLLPDEVVDALVVHGNVEVCADHVRRYVANGVDTPVLALLPIGIDQRQAAHDLVDALR